MASERLIIEVSSRGARVVSGQIGDIGRRAQRSATSVNFLRRALLLVGGTVIVRQLVGLSDEFTNMTNRLRIVTTDTANLTTVQRELLRISNETRTSLSTNAELFTRTSIATRELGLSQRQVITFTQALSQATILSGASAIEANNAIRQLSQGLQSGQLRGEEFRSVAEQLPIVLDILSNDLGVTRGQLRELAFDGQLTADVLVGGLLRAAEDLDQQFRTTVPTIGQALNVLRNNTLQLVGTFSEGTGIGREFASAILFLAQNIDTVARVLAAAGIALIISGITTAVISLTAAIAANPLGALAVGATIAVGALVAFSDQIMLSSTGVADFRDLAIVTFQAFSSVVAVAFDNVTAILGTFGGNFNTVFGGAENRFIQFIRLQAQGLDALVGLFQGVSGAIVAAFANFPRLLADVFLRALNGVLGLVDTFVNSVLSAVNAVTSLTGIEIDPVTIPRLANNFEDAGNAVAEAFVRGFTEGGVGAEQLLNDLLRAAEARAQERLAETNLRDFQQQQATAQLDVGAAAVDQLGAGGNNPDQSVFAGFRNGIQELNREFNDFASLAESTLVNAFKGAEDAFVDFVTTGEADFGGLVDSILQDLLRLAVRQAILGPLFSFLSGPAGAAGGLAGGAGGAAGGFAGGFQTGGTVNPGQDFLVGERGPELLSAGSRGATVTPIQQQAPPTINVINVTDPAEVTSAVNTPEGEEIILNMIRRNPQSVKAALANA